MRTVRAADNRSLGSFLFFVRHHGGEARDAGCGRGLQTARGFFRTGGLFGQSHLHGRDDFAATDSTYGPLSYIAKQSLSKLPFLGAAAEHTGMIPVGRKSPKEDLMKVLSVGVERIQAGESLLVFPQGSRQKVFSRKLYSSIGAKLAEKAQCPVVPIVVDTRCQPTREQGMLKKIFKDFGPVDTAKDIRCACGPVIGPGKSKFMHEAAFDWMASKLESWQLDVER